jgi:hypothetical protein
MERFERLAGSAKNFLGVVSSCAWLGHRIYFSGPLVSHLFQLETLTHKTLQGSREHSFRIWPMILEGRGVEAELQYTYTDHERTHKSFDLKLQLRLSQSTDIVQVAIKCLQSVMAAKFKLGLLEPVTGALLQLASSQDIVSHAPRWRDPQWNTLDSFAQIQYVALLHMATTKNYVPRNHKCSRRKLFLCGLAVVFQG